MQPITGQRRYANGGSVSRGRFSWSAPSGTRAFTANIGDAEGYSTDEEKVATFVEHMSPLLFLWFGVARTRQP